MKKTNSNVIFSKDLYKAFIEAGIPFPSCKFKAGQFVRFPTDGTETDGSGWCKLFADHTGAVFGDYRTAKSYTWQQRDANAPPPSQSELAEARRRSEQQRQAAEEERAAEQAIAKEEAERLLSGSTELDVLHPYVARKGITPFGGRQLPEGTLLLPVYGPEGELQSVQIIRRRGKEVPSQRQDQVRAPDLGRSSRWLTVDRM